MSVCDNCGDCVIFSCHHALRNASNYELAWKSYSRDMYTQSYHCKHRDCLSSPCTSECVTIVAAVTACASRCAGSIFKSHRSACKHPTHIIRSFAPRRPVTLARNYRLLSARARETVSGDNAIVAEIEYS